MKRTFLLIAFGTCFAFLLCPADEYVDSKSPDGKFALHVTREDKQPFRQTDALMERATRKMIVDLDKDQPFDPEAKLSWASDSQRFAYVRRTNDEDESVATRIFQRNGARLDEIKLPDLPSPKMPAQASASEKQQVRIEDKPQPPHWYFELSRLGRTVVTRSLKIKKVLDRVTWNGEKFIEEKK